MSWSTKEELTLMNAVDLLSELDGGDKERFHTRRWIELEYLFAMMFPDGEKTHDRIMHHWQKVLDPVISKDPWPPEFVNVLRQGVEQYGCTNWVVISNCMFGGVKTGKQCREKWENELKPGLNLGEWTEDEEQLLLLLVDEYKKNDKDPSWQEIHVHWMPTRSANQIKNKYHNLKKKKKNKR